VGGGASSQPDLKKAPWLLTVDYYVEELGALVDFLGWKQFHLLGSSWGTILGQAYAFTKDPRLRAVILSGPLSDGDLYWKSQWDATQGSAYISRQNLGVETSLNGVLSKHYVRMMGFNMMKQASTSIENSNIFTLDTHNFVESSGSLRPLDLPLVDSPAGGYLKCFVDIITDVSDFPKTEIKQAIVRKQIHDLPAPNSLTQKIDLPTKLDIAIIKQNNGTFCVVKIVKIVNLKEKVKVSRVQDLCYGKCQAEDWVGDIKAIKKGLHYMFEWVPVSVSMFCGFVRMVSSRKFMKFGKTPVARTLAMAIPRYWIHKTKKAEGIPTYVSHDDFLKPHTRTRRCTTVQRSSDGEACCHAPPETVLSRAVDSRRQVQHDRVSEGWVAAGIANALDGSEDRLLSHVVLPFWAELQMDMARLQLIAEIEDAYANGQISAWSEYENVLEAYDEHRALIEGEEAWPEEMVEPTEEDGYELPDNPDYVDKLFEEDDSAGEVAELASAKDAMSVQEQAQKQVAAENDKKLLDQLVTMPATIQELGDTATKTFWTSPSWMSAKDKLNRTKLLVYTCVQRLLNTVLKKPNNVQRQPLQGRSGGSPSQSKKAQSLRCRRPKQRNPVHRLLAN
ncbi:pip, partial [Symbiodinium microadriaticum]